MSSRIERKEDVVELYQYGRLYLRAFLGSGRVGIETQGVGNPVVDTYDLREFIKVVDLAYAEAAAEQTQTEAKPESLKEESSAAAEPAAARSVSEGEGLAARIEELIEVVKGIDETVGSFGYSLGLLNVEGSAGDLEDLEMVLDEAEKLADRARSLLVPKEEA